MKNAMRLQRIKHRHYSRHYYLGDADICDCPHRLNNGCGRHGKCFLTKAAGCSIERSAAFLFYKEKTAF